MITRLKILSVMLFLSSLPAHAASMAREGWPILAAPVIVGTCTVTMDDQEIGCFSWAQVLKNEFSVVVDKPEPTLLLLHVDPKVHPPKYEGSVSFLKHVYKVRFEPKK